MWQKIKDFFLDEVKSAILILIISALGLAAGFFNLKFLPFNAAWLAIVLRGLPILKDAAIGLFTAFDIKANVLVSLALIASIIIGEIFAAGEVAFILAIGGFLETRTVAKARADLEKPMNLTPTTARVLRNGAETPQHHYLYSLIPLQIQSSKPRGSTA